jgi:thioredoxin-related protein
MSSERERPALAAPISGKPTLLVYESASCGWCRHFRNNVAPDYERSHLEALAPLKYMDISELRRGNAGYRLHGQITATPTFVLVDRGGREVERLRGLPDGRDAFMNEVERMLGRLPESASN